MAVRTLEIEAKVIVKDTPEYTLRMRVEGGSKMEIAERFAEEITKVEGRTIEAKIA